MEQNNELTKNDIIEFIELIRVNYDGAYSGLSVDETKLLKNFWYESLKQYPQDIVKKAVHNSIRVSEYTPKLSNIISEIEKLLAPSTKSDEELWAELSSVLGRVYDVSRYLSYPQYTKWANGKLNEIYGGLSDELKLFAVNVSTLVDIAEMSDESLQYERARFFRQMPVLKRHNSDRATAQQLLAQTKSTPALLQGADKKNKK